MMISRMCAVLLGTTIAALLATHAGAQDAKPTPKETAAIRGCVAKNAKDDTDKAERLCVLKLVATPCTNRPQSKSTVAIADCYRVEQAIWEDILAENLKALTAELDDAQKDKLKAMQEAWVTSRERTCAFYYDKIQGTMATISGAACAAQETARRALLVKAFQGL